MGQEEVLNYLEEVGDWKTSKEIHECIGGTRVAVGIALKKLHWSNDIERERMVINHRHMFKWRAV